MDSLFTNLSNSYPIWIALCLWLILTFYKDILKPYLDRRLSQSLEIEKKNKEISKYNEENERWNRLFKYIQESKSDILTLPTARRYILSAVTWSSYEFIKEIMIIFKENDINNPQRQISIKNHLTNFVRSEKERIENMFSGVFYQNIEISKYMAMISNEHSVKFIDSICKIIFRTEDKNNAIRDAVRTIENHYKEHCNEFFLFLKENSIKE